MNTTSLEIFQFYDRDPVEVVWAVHTAHNDHLPAEAT
jgi:hypothetical protein